MKTTYVTSLIVLAAGLFLSVESRGDDESAEWREGAPTRIVSQIHDDRGLRSTEHFFSFGQPVRVFGRSVSELGARWYKHFFSFSEEQNPANQQGSIDCAAKNRGPIWFLNGTTAFGFGELAVVEYHCEIKPRLLFLPTLNVFFADFPDEDFSVELKRQFIKPVVDSVCVHEVTLDDEPLIFSAPVMRAQTRPFALNLPNGYGSVGLPPGLPIDDPEVVGDGLWLAIPALSPGQHKLNYVVGGLCDANGVPQAGFDVTYHLTVGSRLR